MLKYLLYVLVYSTILTSQLYAGVYKEPPTQCPSHVSTSVLLFENQLGESPKKAHGKKKPYVDNFIVMRGRNHGMFHVFDCVCNLIKCYEVGNCRGIEVNFDTNGAYYDQDYGKNWWSYYCEPIILGQKINVKTVVGAGTYINFWNKKPIVRKEIFRLIKKYFHIKAHIQTKIDTFEKENFKDSFVISVHYRGTDKIAESPYVPYEKVPEEILKVMKTYGNKKFKIFVATDEQAFLDYMIALFGDRVCYNKDALRSTSGKPVHLDKTFSRYKCGEDALIDCILLSKGNFLIRSSSNLSRWSTYFNPNIRVIELNVRYNGRSITLP